jgi:hypothetical protein
MRRLGLVIGAAVVVTAQAAAADARFEKSLQKLDPATRLEQICDYTAMMQIRKDDKNYRPDRALANAMADANVSNDTIKAPAGAFRSGGKWYRLTYSCTASPDHLKVISFRYTIGPEIPETQWAAYGLWR